MNSMPIDSASGALTLPSGSHADPQKVSLQNETVYAAPLCTSRDGSHVYVVYPIENVSTRTISREVVCMVRNDATHGWLRKRALGCRGKQVLTGASA